MGKAESYGEWSETTNTFWFGANDCEWIAWKGSHQIAVHPCGNYPKPPIAMLQHDKRIETIEDFTEAMNNGKYYEIEYKEGAAYWQEPYEGEAP